MEVLSSQYIHSFLDSPISEKLVSMEVEQSDLSGNITKTISEKLVSMEVVFIVYHPLHFPYLISEKLVSMEVGFTPSSSKSLSSLISEKLVSMEVKSPSYISFSLHIQNFRKTS